MVMSDSRGNELEFNQGRLPPQIVNEDEFSGNNIPLPSVFHLGIQLEHLRTLVDSTDEDMPEKRYILRLLANIDTAVTKYYQGGTVSEMIKQQVEQINSSDSLDESINSDQAEQLKKQVTSWIHLLARDLGEEKRIPASESGILDIDTLTERPSELFHQEVWEWLDERPRQDIKEACRSVAVDCATASVMLSLRAVEHCLRKWYEQENESLDAAWGMVLDQLMEEYAEDNKKNDTVLTQLSDLPPVLTTLYYLKEKRNEVNHPEESPTPREARRTLLIISSTITEIYEVLREEDKDESIDEIDIVDSTSIEYEFVDKKTAPLSEQEKLVYNIVRNLDIEQEGEPISRDKIYQIAENSGIPEEQTIEILDELLMSGRVYEPEKDMIKPI